MKPYRSQWIPVVYCVPYSTQYTVQYTIHHTLYCTLYSIVHCVVYSVQCSMQYTVQYMVYYTVYGILCSMGLGLSADNSKASCGTYFIRPSWDANPFIHCSIICDGNCRVPLARASKTSRAPGIQPRAVVSVLWLQRIRHASVWCPHLSGDSPNFERLCNGMCSPRGAHSLP